MPDQDRRLAIGLAAGAVVVAGGAALALSRRQGAGPLLAVTEPWSATYNLIVFDVTDDGNVDTGVLVKHPKQAPLEDLAAAVARACRLSAVRLFLQVRGSHN